MRVLAARSCCPTQSSGAFAETKCVTSAERHVSNGLAKRRHLPGGGLTAAAVPQYKLARKSEQDLAADGDLSSTSGGRFPFKVRGNLGLCSNVFLLIHLDSRYQPCAIATLG